MADDARKGDLSPASLGMLDGEAGAAGNDARHCLARAGDRIGPAQGERQVRARKTIAFMGSPKIRPMVAAETLEERRLRANRL